MSHFNCISLHISFDPNAAILIQAFISACSSELFGNIRWTANRRSGTLRLFYFLCNMMETCSTDSLEAGRAGAWAIQDMTKKAFSAALFATLVWAAIAHAQVPDSCAGWLENQDQTGTRASEVKMRIVHFVRFQAHRQTQEPALQSFRNQLCLNLNCFNDADILAEVSKTCTKNPTYTLEEAISDVTYTLMVVHLDRDLLK
jgi:hypothetical protein